MQPSGETDPAVRAALCERAGASGVLSFEAFMDVALYAPGIGYYRKDRARVGYGEGSDFLTATASSPLLGRLVAAAATTLLSPKDPGAFDFVELGAERGKGILEGTPHPFRSVRLVGVGEPLNLKGPSVVFSNELFDAQPFRRFRRTGGAWRELGVLVTEGPPRETVLPPSSDLPPGFPQSAPEGYVIDAPVAASALLRTIAAEPWNGLFLAFDYGKSWQELISATPQGTARAYRRHTQSNDLLAHPADQDLTCHVCWDWLSEALTTSGFRDPRVESQEAFFVHHAGDFLAAFTASEAGRLSRDKLALMQLIHPTNMGQKFQVLWALRQG